VTLPHSRKNLTADTGMEFNLQAARVPSRLKPELQTKALELICAEHGVQSSGCTDSVQAKA